jgi:hypothetical protein
LLITGIAIAIISVISLVSTMLYINHIFPQAELVGAAGPSGGQPQGSGGTLTTPSGSLPSTSGSFNVNDATQRRQYLETVAKDYYRQNVFGLANLVAVIRAANQIYTYKDAKELSSDISWVYTYNTGSNTLLSAAFNTGAPFKYGTTLFDNQGVMLTDSEGWHPDYDDFSDHQVFHLWATVETTAQGGMFTSAYGDYIHECLDFRDFGDDGILGPRSGTTIEDVRLSMAGIFLGSLINQGTLSAIQVADWVERWFTSPWQDLVNHYSLTQLDSYVNTRSVCPLVKPALPPTRS